MSAAVADCTKLLRQHENRTKGVDVVGARPDREVNASPRKRAKRVSA